jgi:hypothetical protein
VSRIEGGQVNPDPKESAAIGPFIPRGVIVTLVLHIIPPSPLQRLDRIDLSLSN